MWQCDTCNRPVQPGCPDVPGADGFLLTLLAPDGTARTRAYHFQAACNGGRHTRRRSRPLSTRGDASPDQASAA